MQKMSYRLTHYEIIVDGNGGIWWKSHRGFAETKSGRCFIEGSILFLGCGEETELGLLKNEWLEYLKQFPQWDKTRYYCPSYTLYPCEQETMQARKKHPGKAKLSRFSRAEGTIVHPPRCSALGTSVQGKLQQGLAPRSSASESVEKAAESEPGQTVGSPAKSKGGRGLVSQAASAGIEQVKGKLGKALHRCKGLIRHNSAKEDAEE